MRKSISSLLLILLVVNVANAQNKNPNPFAKYGRKADVRTYSQGRFVEIIENDTLIKIGDVVLNSVTREIEGFIETDTAYSEATLEPEIYSFASVDPLSKNFPELSPYQYASNCPISGIDLDGLEYFSVHVLIKDGKKQIIRVQDFTEMTEAQAYAVHGQKDFYKIYSKSFGEKGRGVAYVYYNEGKNGELTKVGEDFFGSRKNAINYLSKHGLYYGAGAPTTYGGDYNYHSNPYNFSFAPIDEVDELALSHDKDPSYNQPNYKDGDWLNDPNSIEADRKFVQGLKEYLNRANKQNYKDKLTNRSPSKEALTRASNAIFLFESYVIPNKEKKLQQQNKNK